MAKFTPWKKKFCFFLSILSARLRGMFWTPELWSGTQKEDFQQWIHFKTNVHKTDNFYQKVISFVNIASE